jgi:GNAT superfamily N-acetyltransferase
MHGVTVQRVREPAELVQFLEAREPAATQILTHVLRTPSAPKRARWIVSSAGDRVGTVVLERRQTTANWHAHVLLDEPDSGAEAGAVVQRSPARSFAGPESSVEPVRRHVPRASTQPRRRLFVSYPALAHDDFVTLAAQAGVGAAPGEGCRPATLSDLDTLTELYSGYELNGGVPLHQLRKGLRSDIVDDCISVLVMDGEILAALTVRRTHRFAVTVSVTVPPEHRGKGLAVTLGAWQTAREAAAGRGMCGERAMSNRMRITGEGIAVDGFVELVYTNVGLAPRVRFRGRERLRVALLRMRGRRARPRPVAQAQTPTP